MLSLHLCFVRFTIFCSCLFKLFSMRIWEMVETKLFVILFLHLLGVIPLCLDVFEGFNIQLDLFLLYLSLSTFHVCKFLRVVIYFPFLLCKLFDSILCPCLLFLFSYSHMFYHLLFGFLFQVFIEEHCLFSDSVFFR